jgi:O-antigen ligase
VLFAAALPVAMAPMNLAAGLCAVATLAVWLARPGPRWARNPTDLPALAWLAAMVIATLGSQDPLARGARLSRGLIPLITGLAAWHARDGRRGRAALAALLASTSVAALIGCGRFLAAGGRFPTRAIGFGGSWMTFGLQTMLLVSLGVGLAITTRGRWRVAALAGSLAGALGLVTSFTRSAWLGLVAALAVMVGLRRPRWLLLLALAAAACVLLPGDLGDRLRSAFDPAHPSNVERTMMWESGAQVFRDHPWIGAGLQNLRPLLERYRSPLATEHPAHVHDSYLQVAISTGLVGLAAFLALCVALVRTAGMGLAGSRRASGIGAGVRLGVTGGVVGFMVGALFDHAFGDQMLTFMLFTLVGLAWAARAWDQAEPARAEAVPVPAPGATASPAGAGGMAAPA